MGMFGFASAARRRLLILLAAASAIVIALAGTVVAMNADADDSVQIASDDAGTPPPTHDHAKMLRDQRAAGEHDDHNKTAGSTAGSNHAAQDDTKADGHHTAGSAAGRSSHARTASADNGTSGSHPHDETATGGTSPPTDGHGSHTTTPGTGSTPPSTHGHHTPGSTTPGSSTPTTVADDLDGPPRSTAEKALLDRTRAAVANIPNNEAGVLAAGYSWIGDGGANGFRHYVNWTYFSDGIEMDHNRIESLVMKRGPNGQLRIETAMYILNLGKTLSQVPNIPGNLISWHNHTNLCFIGNPARLTSCNAPGAINIVTPPMVHVWMKYNPPNPLIPQCGPFVGVDGHGVGCSHGH